MEFHSEYELRKGIKFTSLMMMTTTTTKRKNKTFVNIGKSTQTILCALSSLQEIQKFFFLIIKIETENNY